MQENRLYLAILHSLGISHKKFYKIFEQTLFENNTNYKEFYEKLNSDVLMNYGFKTEEINNILKRKKNLKVNFIKNKLEERSVEIIINYEDDFPEELKNIPNIPYLIYVRGQIPSGPKIAVVGSRNITSYGKKVILNLIPNISKYFIILSGGAYGVDTEAHLETLKSGNKTIAVIGTSISEDYPTGNKKMYDNIVEKSGAIISIFAIGIPGNSYNFPIRNEIVVGLSSGVVVIEAREKSGSLITSKLALDLGKELFAVPGEVFKLNSVGCNNLIKNGEAKLVNGSIDILEEYNFSNNKKRDNNLERIKPEFSDELEEKIYNALLLESYTNDELVKKFNLDISIISFKLSMLEINGLIKKTLGGKFEIK
ncbi:MAG: DNA-processing protein DprA [Candidatus Gracilibacteria bacterium]|nr:DNA-processing protein DprA [Candidatus Gracilibacteria bacterium]